jgi:hypothetical protein
MNPSKNELYNIIVRQAAKIHELEQALMKQKSGFPVRQSNRYEEEDDDDDTTYSSMPSLISVKDSESIRPPELKRSTNSTYFTEKPNLFPDFNLNEEKEKYKKEIIDKFQNYVKNLRKEKQDDALFQLKRYY